MADEASIFNVLSAFAGVTGLLGSGANLRIFDQRAPANLSKPVQTPFVVMTTILDSPHNHLSDIPTLSQFNIQFDFYGTSKAQCKGVLNQFRLALYDSGFVGSEDATRDLPADDPNLRRISSDWTFQLAR